MSLVVLLIALATAIDGLLAGLNLDTALVRIPCMPTHRCSGVCDLCSNDLRTGLFIYPLLGRGAALRTGLATAIALVSHARMEVVLPLSFASLLSLLYTFVTTRAAPILLSLKDTPDDEALLTAKLERLAGWHSSSAGSASVEEPPHGEDDPLSQLTARKSVFVV
jgi:hypothetical protein